MIVSRAARKATDGWISSAPSVAMDEDCMTSAITEVVHAIDGFFPDLGDGSGMRIDIWPMGEWSHE